MSSNNSEDEECRTELEHVRSALLFDSLGQRLLKTLRQRLGTTTDNLYIVRWTPEQAEDIYEVLVDGASVARVELSRSDGTEAEFALLSIKEYREQVRTYTRPERRKFRIAMDLALRRSQR